MSSLTRTVGVVIGLVLTTTACSVSSTALEQAERPGRAVVEQDRTKPARALPGRASVIAISVDGLSPAAIRTLGPGRAPALHEMLRRGAGTFDARTLREQTVTLPNHTTMLTGRRATGPDGHGVTVNDDPGGTVAEQAGHPVASVFDVVREQGGSTALYVSKSKFALFERSWDVERFRYAAEGRLVDALLRRLRRQPDPLSFLHLALPDAAGHDHGFGSRPYLRAVRRADALVGSVLRTVAADRALARTTTVVLTADHGGSGTHHEDPTLASSFTVPFLVWGAGVARGVDLYRLNPRLESPGRSRTDYRGPQPVRNGDLANLALDLLGLPPVPGSTFNRDQRLRVARSS
jgi:hypothetical protein